MGDQGQVGGRPGRGAELSAAIMGAGPLGLSAAAPGTSDDSAPAPQHIGHFKILERLGVGGMGVVYKAQQERPHRLVALKVIRAGLLGARAIRRFEFEAEILGRLQHPGIAQIYETGAFDAGEGVQPYFAMELIHGRPLTRFAREHRLDVRQRLGLMTRICDAVQHAHQRGVIHRDLKPANILVAEAAEGRGDEGTKGSGQPKILDFGVARATDADITVTLSGADLNYAAGTLPYMSPEQVAGAGAGVGGGDRQAVDVRSDVYSLGVVCYELLTDRLPYTFASNSIFEAARVIGEEDAPPAGSVDRLLRGDVETILRAAMEKEPSRRYQSVAEFAGDIERFLNHEPIRARQPSAAYRLRKFARRNRALVSGLAAAFAILLLGIAGTTWQAVRATRSEWRIAQRVDDLRAFARTVIFDLNAAIGGLPDSGPAQRILVESALSYLDRLKVEAGSDEGLLEELARGYQELGNIQGAPGRRSLGDTDGALASYQQAVALRATLLRIGPDDPDRQRRFAHLHQCLGNLFNLTARFDQAAGAMVVARNAYRSVWEQNPDDSLARNWFVTASFKLAENHRDMAGVKAPEIVAIANDTAEKLESFREPEVETADYEAHPALAHFYLARLCLLSGQVSRVNEHFDIAQALAERAVETHPDVSDLALTLGNVHQYRAQMYLAAGEPSEAADEIARAVAIYAQVVAANPKYSSARHAVPATQMELASALAAAGRAEEAIEAARAAVSGMEVEAAIEPHSQAHQLDLLFVHVVMAQVLERLADDALRALPQRLNWLRQSRDQYAHCLDLVAQDQQRGMMAVLDEWYMKELERAIPRCDATIAMLEAENAALARYPATPR